MTADSPRVLNLRWTSPPEAEWNGERGGFRILLVETETNTQRRITLPNSGATSYRIANLHPFYSYTCRIAAYNSAGTGPYSATVSAMLPPDGE